MVVPVAGAPGAFTRNVCCGFQRQFIWMILWVDSLVYFQEFVPWDSAGQMAFYAVFTFHFMVWIYIFILYSELRRSSARQSHRWSVTSGFLVIHPAVIICFRQNGRHYCCWSPWRALPTLLIMVPNNAWEWLDRCACLCVCAPWVPLFHRPKHSTVNMRNQRCISSCRCIVFMTFFGQVVIRNGMASYNDKL